MSRRSIVGLAGFGVLTVTLSACGSSGGSTSNGSTGGGAAKSLDGSDWVLTSMTPPVPELADAPVSAAFTNGCPRSRPSRSRGRR